MDEDVFNMSVRKFLKKVGVTAQREIEHAVREAIRAGRVKDGGTIEARVVLRLPAIGLEVPIDGSIETA